MGAEHDSAAPLLAVSVAGPTDVIRRTRQHLTQLVSIVCIAITVLIAGRSAIGPSDAQPYPNYSGRQPLHSNSGPPGPAQQPASTRVNPNTDEWWNWCVTTQIKYGFGRDAGHLCNNKKMRINGVKPYGR